MKVYLMGTIGQIRATADLHPRQRFFFLLFGREARSAPEPASFNNNQLPYLVSAWIGDICTETDMRLNIFKLLKIHLTQQIIKNYSELQNVNKLIFVSFCSPLSRVSSLSLPRFQHVSESHFRNLNSIFITTIIIIHHPHSHRSVKTTEPLP